MLASAKTDIRFWRKARDIVEQSSNDIWRSVCSSVREAVAAARRFGGLSELRVTAVFTLRWINSQPPIPLKNQ
jgi:hypothetical protein